VVFGDPVATTAILNPLLHQCHVIMIRHERYRLREKRLAGLLGDAPRGAEQARRAGAGGSPSAPRTNPPGRKPSKPRGSIRNVAMGSTPGVASQHRCPPDPAGAVLVSVRDDT
jgi:hypothetical protein